jgi:hypothetical protein
MIDQPIIAVKMLGVLRTLLAKVEFPILSKYERTMRVLLVPFT